jgi:hypothetical protein
VTRQLVKRVAAILLVVVIFVALTLAYFWEAVGGAYPNWYNSPSHDQYKVVIYDYAGGFAGSTAFALYGANADHQLFLGYLGMEDKSDWTPWNCNLNWTQDGTITYAKDEDYRVAYSFEENCLLIRRGLPRPPGSRRPVKFVEPADFVLFIKEHGGEGSSFFNEFQETNWIWRDFVPSENN